MLLLLLVGLLPVLPASDSPLRLPCHRQLSITQRVLLLAIMLLLIGCLKRIIYNRRYLLCCLIAAILAAVNPNRRHICCSCRAAGPSTLAGSIRCTPSLAGPSLHATTILSDSCHWLLLCSLCMLRNDWADNQGEVTELLITPQPRKVPFHSCNLAPKAHCNALSLPEVAETEHLPKMSSA
jgi:hypothetical protein